MCHFVKVVGAEENEEIVDNSCQNTLFWSGYPTLGAPRQWPERQLTEKGGRRNDSGSLGDEDGRSGLEERRREVDGGLSLGVDLQ